MSAADDAYARLMAAQRRVITPEEAEQREKDSARESKAVQIRRRLQQVY